MYDHQNDSINAFRYGCKEQFNCVPKHLRNTNLGTFVYYKMMFSESLNRFCLIGVCCRPMDTYFLTNNFFAAGTFNMVKSRYPGKPFFNYNITRSMVHIKNEFNLSVPTSSQHLRKYFSINYIKFNNQLILIPISREFFFLCIIFT